MTDKEKDEIITTRKAPTWDGYWFDNILGYSVIIMCPLLMLIFAKDSFKDLSTPIQILTTFAWVLSIIMAYGYFTERNLKILNNQFTKDQNQQILKESLTRLNWKYQYGRNKLELNIEKQKFLLRFVRIILIPEDNIIAFNMMYYGGYNGRWPYFIGVKTYLSWKLQKEITKTTHNKVYSQ